MKEHGRVWVWGSGGAAAPQGTGAGTRLLSAHGSALLGLGCCRKCQWFFSIIEEKCSPECVSWKETVLILCVIRSLPPPHRASPDALPSSLALHPRWHRGGPAGFQLLVPAQSHSSIPRVWVQGGAEGGRRQTALQALEGRRAHSNLAAETHRKTRASPIAHRTPCTSDTRLDFPPLLNPEGVDLLQNLLVFLT